MGVGVRNVRLGSVKGEAIGNRVRKARLKKKSQGGGCGLKGEEGRGRPGSVG